MEGYKFNVLGKVLWRGCSSLLLTCSQPASSTRWCFWYKLKFISASQGYQFTQLLAHSGALYASTCDLYGGRETKCNNCLDKSPG